MDPLYSAATLCIPRGYWDTDRICRPLTSARNEHVEGWSSPEADIIIIFQKNFLLVAPDLSLN